MDMQVISLTLPPFLLPTYLPTYLPTSLPPYLPHSLPPQVQEIEATVDPETVTMAAVEANIARCPDEETAQKMIARIDEIRKTGNSVGGREGWGGEGGREGGGQGGECQGCHSPGGGGHPDPIR